MRFAALPMFRWIAGLALLTLIITPAPPTVAQAALAVDTTADSTDLLPGDGQCRDADGRCSLRAAVQEANAHAGWDLIQVPPGLYRLTRTGRFDDTAVTGDLDLLDAVTIVGAGHDQTIIDPEQRDRGIDVLTSAGVVLQDLRIQQGWSIGEAGAGLQARGPLRLLRVTIDGNGSREPSQWGAGLAVWGAAVTIEESTFSNNTSTAGVGGAIAGDATATLTIRASRFEANQPGAIYQFGAAQITDSQFRANRGGSTVFNFGTMTIHNTVLERNRDGVGIVRNDGTLTMTRVWLTQSVSDLAGGVWNTGTLHIAESAITENAITGYEGAGGGIFNTGTATVRRSQILRNESRNSGLAGGVYNRGTMVLESSTIAENVGDRAAGGILNDGAMTIINSTISGNRTARFGGGISHASDAPLYLVNVTITGNVANSDRLNEGDGGGIESTFAQGPVILIHTIVAGNEGDGPSDCRGTLQSVGVNLVQATRGCQIAGDVTDLLAADPHLASLADNGGVTLTHMPLPGSPAIDAGDPAGCRDAQGVAITADQRGVSRPLDGDGDGASVCDLGAVEAPPGARPTATATATPTATPIGAATPTPTQPGEAPTVTPSPPPTEEPTAAPTKRAVVTVALLPQPNVRVRPEGILTATLVITNRGQGMAQAVHVRFPFTGAALQVLDATMSRPDAWVSAVQEDAVEVRIGRMGSQGDTVQVTIRFRVRASAALGTSLGEAVIVTWSDGQPGGRGASNAPCVAVGPVDVDAWCPLEHTWSADGRSLQIAGAWMMPNEPVALWYHRASAGDQPIGTVTADQTGAFRLTIDRERVPADTVRIVATGVWSTVTTVAEHRDP